MSQLESGRAVPSEELARRLASVLQQDEEEFLLSARRISDRVGDLLEKFPKLASLLPHRTESEKAKPSYGRRNTMVRLVAGAKNAEEIINALKVPEYRASSTRKEPPANDVGTLADTFDIVRPSIIAFASRHVPTKIGERPIFPDIIGTGFVVDSRGIVVTNRHVAEALQQLPPHPKTGATSAMAIISPGPETTAGGVAFPVLFAEIKAYSHITSFSSNGPYYGEAIPDLAFVQLKVRDLPALSLVTEPNTIRAGIPVATAGFPMGTDPLVVYGSISQLTPFLRKGIISSVYPYPCPNPHGFTMDIVSQGGASGSPVFCPDSPKVLGIVHAAVQHSGQPTNVTIALPSLLVSEALEACTNGVPLDLSGVPTMDDLLRESPRTDELRWESFVARKPSTI
jgi:S1-C subfamily serine protease